MTLLGDALLDEAGDLLDEVVALRRRIHRRPELGLDLPVTQATIREALDGLGLDVRTGTATTSVVADLRGGAGDGPTVLLRGDMDALPMPEDTGVDFASEVAGAMHACGHDAHVSMLVGAARLLAARRDQIAGTVRFMFQPGEEGFGGAKVMIDEGVLDGVDAAFAMHITPNLPSGWITTKPGPLMASSDELFITVRGRGGHASTPHFAADPIPVACEIVSAISTFVTRQIDAFNPAIVTITKITAGTTVNVIPASAEMAGTIRSVSERTRDAVDRGVTRLATTIAEAHGLEAEVHVRRGYPVTVNHAAAAHRVLEVASGLLGADRVVESPAPVMGAEDWSYVLQQVPGAMAFLGVCPPEIADPRQAPACHSNLMRLDEPAMAAGVALHTAMALDLLERPLA
ncbi:MAG TPA: M20 family metallopeptidase [Acidimicrobiales bacterium]|nr:M20 family metallopeptidase [Acidimicrobiales bacterium]